MELRDHLATVSKSQDQDQKRLDALQRRMESLERIKDVEPSKPKLDEAHGCALQKLEGRLAKLEETTVSILPCPSWSPAARFRATTDSKAAAEIWRF